MKHFAVGVAIRLGFLGALRTARNDIFTAAPLDNDTAATESNVGIKS
jgi:hypothetical protein